MTDNVHHPPPTINESSPITFITDQCRICFEDDIPDNMIYPCRCAGTNKYVHDHCLKQWIIMSDNPEYKTKCPTCHYDYNITQQNINADALKCNNYFEYLSHNLWKPFFINQVVLLLCTWIIAILDETNTYPYLFNYLSPAVDTVTTYGTSQFFVYYTFTCILYIFIWILTILTSIALLKDVKMLYLKKTNVYVVIATPIILAITLYINLITVVLGTFTLTRLIQIWVSHHIHVVNLIKSVNRIDIHNYEMVDELPPAT